MVSDFFLFFTSYYFERLIKYHINYRTTVVICVKSYRFPKKE